MSNIVLYNQWLVLTYLQNPADFPEHNKIYYIGDLTFNWNINKNDGANTGVLGAMSDAEKK